MKYMKRGVIITLTFVLALIIAGCTGNNVTPTIKHHPVTGIELIEVDFAKDAPSSAQDFYFGKEPIPVEVELKNKGIKDIAKAKVKVKLRGIAATDSFSGNKGAVNPDEDLPSIDIYGETTQTTPVYANIGEISYKKDLIERTYKATIEADVCYEYVTNVITDLYISNDPREMSGVSIKQYDNPPSPVQASSLKQTAGAKDNIRFDIEIKNVGNGKIIDECFQKSKKGKTNEENVKVEFEPGVRCSRLSGSNSGEVRLRDGAVMLQCTVSFDPDNLRYYKRIPINLGFKYQKTIQRDVYINKEE